MKLPNFEKYYNTPYSLRYGKFSLDNIVLFEPKIVTNDTPLIQMFIKCDSKYFRDMFNAVADPSNNYVTYANEEIVQNAIYKHSIFPIEKVAIILKNTNNERPWAISDVTQRLSNHFGLPTAYSRNLRIGHDTFILTVDYVEFGKYFFTLKDFFAHKDNLANNRLKVVISKIRSELRDLQRSTKVPVEQRKQMAKEFVAIYFFRKYIISDKSFTGDKVGVIYDTERRQYCWAPCYDMEDSFTNLVNVLPMLEEDIQTAITLYPKRMKKIINNYERIASDDNLYTTLKKDLPEKDAFLFSRLVKHRLLLIINIYNYFCK